MKLFALIAGLWVVMPAASRAAETVLLLHGLGRTSWSMNALASALEREGFVVVNPSYPWRSKTLEQLASEWLPSQLAAAPATSRLHVVTHSMGAVIVRLWLREHGASPNLGRVVMLAPPNAGSEIPDRLAGSSPVRWLVGPNLARLGTTPEALPAALGPWPAPTVDLGIIAGDASGGQLFGSAVPAPHDGKVSVASTHLAGERDHLVVPFSHTWIAWRAEAAAQTAHFLREGRFRRPAENH